MINQEKLGKFIEKLRKEKNLTQGDLAEQLGLSNSAVSKWECGNNLPDILMLEPLSKVLGVTVHNLLNCQDPSEEELANMNDAKVRKKCFDNIKYLTCIMCLMLVVLLGCLPLIIKSTSTKLNPPVVEENNVRVYEITSEDENIRISGYIIFDNKENIVKINSINYQSSNRGTDLEIKAENIKINFMIDNKFVFFYETENENNDIYTLSEILSQLSFHQDVNIETNYKLADLEPEFSTAVLRIECYREEQKVEELNINISLQEKFNE